VTDEMRDVVFRLLMDAGNTVFRQDVRAALETALADVPEPNDQAEVIADGYAGMVRQQQERIAELEAQLAAERLKTEGWQRACHLADERVTAREAELTIVIAEYREFEAQLAAVRGLADEWGQGAEVQPEWRGRDAREAFGVCAAELRARLESSAR
jgi:hypothetical protein